MIYQNLIINKNIWLKLEKMFHSNQMPHALLFHGPEGCGKEAHAIEMASLLNYKTKSDLEKIKIFQHPNIHLIIPLPKDKAVNKKTEAINVLSSKSIEQLIDMKKKKMLFPYKKIYFKKSSTILINSIRDIKKKSHLNINSNKNSTVYLIFEAEKMCYPRQEAGNALLKILEEPPPNTIFILVTSKKELMLDTILSRCCSFSFPKISNQKIFQYLKDENYNFNNQNELLVKLFSGNLNTILYSEISKEITQFIKQAQLLISALIKNENFQQYYNDMERLIKNKKIEFEVFVKLLIFILYDLDKIKNNLNDCLILKDTTKVKNLNYIKCIETIEKNYEELNKNVNPSIGLFSMIIEMKKILNQEIINE